MHPVCTTMLSPRTAGSNTECKKNKHKSRRLELMCDIDVKKKKKLNKNWLTYFFFYSSYPKFSLKNP